MREAPVSTRMFEKAGGKPRAHRNRLGPRNGISRGDSNSRLQGQLWLGWRLARYYLPPTSDGWQRCTLLLLVIYQTVRHLETERRCPAVTERVRDMMRCKAARGSGSKGKGLNALTLSNCDQEKVSP